jgi:hypothetical protein
MDRYEYHGINSPNVWMPINDTNKIQYVRTFGDISPKPSTRLEDTSLFTKVLVSLHEQVYGYYRFGDTLVILPWVVLLSSSLAHCCTVILGKPWSSNASSALGEILIFALQSSPSAQVANISAGMENWQARKLTAAVRDSALQSKLSMVPLNVAQDEKSLDREEAVIPRPDVKYT